MMAITDSWLQQIYGYKGFMVKIILSSNTYLGFMDTFKMYSEMLHMCSLYNLLCV